jgi:fructose/tagatose bisphosphate aldolase
MSFVTSRNEAKAIYDDLQNKDVSVAVFCTASHWNAEAILLAADRLAKKYGIKDIPVSLAMTYTYTHMQQAQRVTRSRDAAAGLRSVMEHVRVLTQGKDAPYANVCVMPHLDHADPERDRWALTEGTKYLASVMFDAQRFPLEQNIKMISEYVDTYGKDVLVEGIIDVLKVSDGTEAVHTDDYVEKAERYVRETGVDFLVADLGTEQQSTSSGNSVYLKDRAVNLTKALGKKMLVLHGTSSLTDEQINGLADDGVIRVNLWTKVAREAGQYAADQLVARYDKIKAGDFEACESMQYIYDSIDHAANSFEKFMELFGYANLA